MLERKAGQQERRTAEAILERGHHVVAVGQAVLAVGEGQPLGLGADACARTPILLAPRASGLALGLETGAPVPIAGRPP